MFCGVQGRQDRSLKLNESFGSEILSMVADLVNEHSPDSLVLYNGGNILRPQEMYQPVILSDIPKFLASHPTCNFYEIESRVDDILLYGKSIEMIKDNLGRKKLRIRLGIEYYDDNLLWRHRKGITQAQINKAVGFLNESGTEWNGYVLLGGLDMDQPEARTSAKKTAKFMADKGAFRISINAMFTTGELERNFGRRIYVPVYSDLTTVLGELFSYCKRQKKTVIFKVGFEEEDIRSMVRMPFVSGGMSAEEIRKRLSRFNLTQDLGSLK
ncbi:MAG: hypothetical protein WC788_01405 [Candidatus Paceibacterota bacterium]